ncbi:MAG TPA: Mov34/MPN/PAD-1 family protein [Planctomycetota bacterium]|nr:Mov34/MPN/PAD-1 family protein [Planctomycetota bacterium]
MAATLDYSNIEKKDAREAVFPTQIASEYRVHIDERAYERMKSHANTTNEVELCGVLIGDVCRDSQGYFLCITAVIEGLHSNNYGAQVTFTHQTWDHINSIKDKEYPKQRIVGWYHTHPGFGVFLSGMDMFIQENFFNLPYQVAIVIETKKHEEGCFAWIEGKSVPLSRYWVGSRQIKLATGIAEPVEVDGPKPMNSAGRSAQPAATYDTPVQYSSGESGPGFLTTLIFMLVALGCGLMLGRYQAVQDIRKEVTASLESEIYSIVEFSALNALASRDFAEIREKMQTIGEKVKAGDAAAQTELKALTDQLAKLEQHYNKSRTKFRDDIEQMMNSRQNLSQRVAATSRHQDELSAAVAMLYVQRASEIIKPYEADPSKFGDLEKETARRILENALRISPGIKPILEQEMPRALEILYGKEQKAAPAASGSAIPSKK